MPKNSIFTDMLALRTVMRDFKRTRMELQLLISKRLRKVLISAYQHVPYYRNIMNSVGYNPVHDYRGPTDLQYLPILTKSILKEHGERSFVREDVDLSNYFKDATSGSTGQPLQVWRSPMARSLQIARWLRVLILNGYRLTDKVLSFTSPARLNEGKSVFQHFGLLRRQPVDYCLAPDQLLKAVLSYKPDVIYGNRSQIDLVAHESIRCGHEIPPIKLVVVGAEVVRDQHRRLYEQVYKAPVIEFYGSVELGIIAFQIDQDKPVLKLCEDQIFYEFLNKDGVPAQPGEMCRAVMTDLANDLMPFIRYDQGDWLEFSSEIGCSGHQWRTIQNIKGRDDDYAILPGGLKVPFHTFYEVMDRYSLINQFRIIQKKEDQFEIIIAAEPDYVNSISCDILANLNGSFPQYQLHFQIKQVNNIEPDSSGKLRMLISEIA